jgi:hypothetical protein
MDGWYSPSEEDDGVGTPSLLLESSGEVRCAASF